MGCSLLHKKLDKSLKLDEANENTKDRYPILKVSNKKRLTFKSKQKKLHTIQEVRSFLENSLDCLHCK